MHIKWHLKESLQIFQNRKMEYFILSSAHAIYKKSRGEGTRVGESSGNHPKGGMV